MNSSVKSEVGYDLWNVSRDDVEDGHGWTGGKFLLSARSRIGCISGFSYGLGKQMTNRKLSSRDAVPRKKLVLTEQLVSTHKLPQKALVLDSEVRNILD